MRLCDDFIERALFYFAPCFHVWKLIRAICEIKDFDRRALAEQPKSNIYTKVETQSN